MRAPSGPPGWHLRAACRADRDALVALERRAFALDRLSRRAFGHLLSRAHAALTVAVGEGGVILGCAVVLLRRRSRVARLYSLAVEPDWQRAGIGGALLVAAEAAAGTAGARLLRLEVRVDAPAVQSFYRRHGFRAVGRRAAYYEDGGAALVMDKPLPAPAPGAN